MVDNKVVAGYHLGLLSAQKVRSALEAVIKLAEEGKIKPEIHEEFSLEEVREPSRLFYQF